MRTFQQPKLNRFDSVGFVQLAVTALTYRNGLGVVIAVGFEIWWCPTESNLCVLGTDKRNRLLVSRKTERRVAHLMKNSEVLHQSESF